MYLLIHGGVKVNPYLWKGPMAGDKDPHTRGQIMNKLVIDLVLLKYFGLCTWKTSWLGAF